MIREGKNPFSLNGLIKSSNFVSGFQDEPEDLHAQNSLAHRHTQDKTHGHSHDNKHGHSHESNPGHSLESNHGHSHDHGHGHSHGQENPQKASQKQIMHGK